MESQAPMYELIASQHAVSPVPDRIARLLDVVRRDLEPDHGLATTYVPPTDSVAHVWAWEPGGHSASGFPIQLTDDDPDAAWIVELAEWMQRTFFEVGDTFATTRPPCGDHPHSMEAELIDGEAWWVCRYTGREGVRRIGDASELEFEPR